MQGNPRQSWIMDSMPWIPDSRYLIPILSRIQDSLSYILDSKAQDTGFHSKNCTYSGIRIPLHRLRNYCRCKKCTYNALRTTPPPKLQNQCCCLPHICIAPHLTDEHSVLLKSGLFLTLFGLDLDLLWCQEQRYLLSSQCWVQGFHLRCSWK